MNTQFKKGQKVKVKVSIGGIITYEKGVISRINKMGIFLDNGPGNDEIGPYDPITGRHILIDEYGTGSNTIIPEK